MVYTRSSYGQLPDRLLGVNRNSDNGWGGYEWSLLGLRRVPKELLGTARYGDLTLEIRRELVPLTVLMWQIAEAVGYKIHSTNPNGNGEDWGPWGYEDRPIGGTVSPSNHSRGRAEDDNAPYNPMVSTFITDMDPRYVNARERCGFYWGGRYDGKTDTMHFEYVGRPEDVAADEKEARKILESLKAPTKPSTPTPAEEDDMPYTEKQIEDMGYRGALRALQSDAGLAAVKRAANEAVTEVSVSQGFANADAFGPEEMAGVIEAVTKVMRSEGASGGGDKEAFVKAITEALGKA
jgi:hypothetical protein